MGSHFLSLLLMFGARPGAMDSAYNPKLLSCPLEEGSVLAFFVCQGPNCLFVEGIELHVSAHALLLWHATCRIEANV